MQHPGVERARESMALYVKGDFDRLRDYYADDVVWHVGGKHPLSGDYRGRDALFGYFRRIRELTGGTMGLEAEAILASDRHVAMFTRVTARRDERTLDVLLAQAFRLDADGRCVEYWAGAEDQDAVDAFWS